MQNRPTSAMPSGQGGWGAPASGAAEGVAAAEVLGAGEALAAGAGGGGGSGGAGVCVETGSFAGEEIVEAAEGREQAGRAASARSREASRIQEAIVVVNARAAPFSRPS